MVDNDLVFLIIFYISDKKIEKSVKSARKSKKVASLSAPRNDEDTTPKKKKVRRVASAAGGFFNYLFCVFFQIFVIKLW